MAIHQPILEPQLARPGQRARGDCENEPRAAVARGRDEAATLEDVVLSAWEGLVASGSAPCPVCREGLLGPAEPCSSCGSVLI